MKRFSVGNVLDTGLRLWLRCLWRFAPVLLVALTPLLAVLAYIASHDSPGERSAAQDAGSFVAYAWPLLELPVVVVVTVAMVGELRGSRPGFEASLRAGLRRLVPTGLVAAAIGVALLAIGLIVMLPLRQVDSAVVRVVGVVLGAGVILAVNARWWLAVPAVIVERPGIVGALRRSGRLTRGRRGRLAVLVVLGVALQLGLAVGISLAFRGGEHDVRITAWAVMQLAWMPLGMLRAVLAATAYALIVEDLEGASPARLDDVFA